ncbi:hypothetical protein Tco_0958227 [Tanacetum coccineum]
MGPGRVTSQINNTRDTALWARLILDIHDRELCSSSLKQQFPRLFRLALNKDASVRDCWNNGWHIVWSRNVSYGNTANLLDNLLNLLKNSTLNDSDDAWVWYSGNSSFTVKDARGKIDDVYLPDDGSETRWNRFVPKKVNVFIWRALRDRLPTRWNLSRRLLALFVIMGLKRLIIRCGFALSLPPSGFGSLNGWTLTLLSFLTCAAYSLG